MGIEAEDFDFDIDPDTYKTLLKVAKRRDWSLDETVRKLLTGGMMATAANYEGYDVVAKMPDGRVNLISSRKTVSHG